MNMKTFVSFSIKTFLAMLSLCLLSTASYAYDCSKGVKNIDTTSVPLNGGYSVRLLNDLQKNEQKNEQKNDNQKQATQLAVCQDNICHNPFLRAKQPLELTGENIAALHDLFSAKLSPTGEALLKQRELLRLDGNANSAQEDALLAHSTHLGDAKSAGSVFLDYGMMVVFKSKELAKKIESVTGENDGSAEFFANTFAHLIKTPHIPLNLTYCVQPNTHQYQSYILSIAYALQEAGVVEKDSPDLEITLFSSNSQQKAKQ